MEGDLIKVNKLLLPFSWIYGMAVNLRNWFFNVGILKSKSYDIPVISVGNITVGGAGKTPHVEYLTSLLQDKMKVAVLSRGYKRKSHGYRLADADTTAADIGDEPLQMKLKHPNVYVAVDKKRCHGIERLVGDEETKDTDVILLDDAYQHRYVKPGLNILLVDYHRLIIYDELLPAGRLREPQREQKRADIIIITKCPLNLKPMEYRVLYKTITPMAYQQVYYTTIAYDDLTPVFGDKTKTIAAGNVPQDTSVLLIAGIASPEQMVNDVKRFSTNIQTMIFGDHHNFKKKDVRKINETFESLPSPKMIVTTEKDVARLINVSGLSDEVKAAMYVQPIHIEFMMGQKETFDKNILNYVKRKSTNSILAERKNVHKSSDSNNTRVGTGTISFRNN